MEMINEILLAVHVASGSASLALFWVPALTRKGKNAHIVSGRLYVYSMWVVLASALFLSVINLIQEQYVLSAFLGFLTVLTAYPLWFGVAILKYKRAVPDGALLVRRILNIVLLFGGLGLVGWSLAMRLQGQTILLLIFGLLGFFVGSGAAFQRNEKFRAEANWLREHLEGMIITGIAAHSAFFSVGASRFFVELLGHTWVFIPWVLPGIIGTIAMRRAVRKWKLA